MKIKKNAPKKPTKKQIDRNPSLGRFKPGKAPPGTYDLINSITVPKKQIDNMTLILDRKSGKVLKARKATKAELKFLQEERATLAAWVDEASSPPPHVAATEVLAQMGAYRLIAIERAKDPAVRRVAAEARRLQSGLEKELQAVARKWNKKLRSVVKAADKAMAAWHKKNGVTP